MDTFHGGILYNLHTLGKRWMGEPMHSGGQAFLEDEISY